jgi:hypothetical protein
MMAMKFVLCSPGYFSPSLPSSLISKSTSGSTRPAHDGGGNTAIPLENMLRKSPFFWKQNNWDTLLITNTLLIKNYLGAGSVAGW